MCSEWVITWMILFCWGTWRPQPVPLIFSWHWVYVRTSCCVEDEWPSNHIDTLGYRVWGKQEFRLPTEKLSQLCGLEETEQEGTPVTSSSS